MAHIFDYKGAPLTVAVTVTTMEFNYVGDIKIHHWMEKNSLGLFVKKTAIEVLGI